MAQEEFRISMVALLISLIMVVAAFSLAVLFFGSSWLNLWSVLAVVIPVLVIWASLTVGITIHTKKKKEK